MMLKQDVLTILICILLMNASVATAQQPSAESTNPSIAPDVVQSAELFIGYGDLLEVSVLGAPEYRYEVRTSSKGEIALPLAGTIRVSGLSVETAEQTIAAHLQQAGAFNNPQVTVFEKEYATQGISVLGEVQKPGIYPLIGPHTLLDAISAAGGTTPRAGTVATITHRADPDTPTTVALSYSETGKPVTTARVQPGDTVMVSKAGLVYVVGDVHEPAGIVLETSGLTVLQAIAMAHGTNPTAKLSAAKLIRKTGDGSKEIAIPLNKILKAKSPDLLLQPEDIVFVPGSAMKGATRRGLEAMVQAATGFVIYH